MGRRKRGTRINYFSYDWVKDYMKELGITQMEMADYCGMSFCSMSLILNGRMIPSLDIVVSIANRLNCCVDDLLEDYRRKY